MIHFTSNRKLKKRAHKITITMQSDTSNEPVNLQRLPNFIVKSVNNIWSHLQTVGPYTSVGIFLSYSYIYICYQTYKDVDSKSNNSCTLLTYLLTTPPIVFNLYYHDTNWFKSHSTHLTIQ
jgi:hypothetical protein